MNSRSARDDNPQVESGSAPELVENCKIDLTTKILADYPTRLDYLRSSINVVNHNRRHKNFLDTSDPVGTIYPLSKTVFDLLETESRASGPLSDSFSERLLGRCERMVLKCNDYVLLKAVRGVTDFTESITLQYLQQHRLDVPVPEPTLDICRYTWHTTGGMGAEGCKDIRRHLRRSNQPIMRAVEIEQFLFEGYRPGGYASVELLRELSPPAHLCIIVFTHGNLRPDNIIYSGFYPEYYEAAKGTNCLSPYEEYDWYLFLPDCVSPERYAHWWLLDRVRETRVVYRCSHESQT
ncbi:hypothetical protein BDW67DRAFT_171936 [Aspergillus spinulosporus]